jgi:hypothetical protein
LPRGGLIIQRKSKVPNHGGKRAGAGRKPKAVEQNLSDLLKECAGDEDMREVLRLLVADSKHQAFSVRNEARKLLLAYKYGKPVERHEVEAEVDVKMITLDEVKKQAAARRQQVEALNDE